MFKLFKARSRAGSAPSPADLESTTITNVSASPCIDVRQSQTAKEVICLDEDDDDAAYPPTSSPSWHQTMGREDKINNKTKSLRFSEDSFIIGGRKMQTDEKEEDDEEDSVEEGEEEPQDPHEGQRVGIWISRSFFDERESAARKQRKEEDRWSAPSLSTSAPTKVARERINQSYSSHSASPTNQKRAAEHSVDELFGRKVPRHVANQEKLFALLEKRETVASAGNSRSPLLQQQQQQQHPHPHPHPHQQQHQQYQQQFKQQQEQHASPLRKPAAMGIVRSIAATESSRLPRPELKSLWDAAREAKARHPGVYENLLLQQNVAADSSSPIEGAESVSSSNSAHLQLQHSHAHSRGHHNHHHHAHALSEGHQPQPQSQSSVVMRGHQNNDEVQWAISKDVARTFTDNDFFGKSSDGQSKLFRILSAYALHCPRVGYCQGINFVVGGLLLANFSEEEAFWAINNLMKKHYLEGMFLPGLPGVKKALKRFEAWFSSLIPNLYSHFENEGIKTEMFTSKWFMSLYAAALPSDLVFKIWQAFLSHGWVAIWAVGLAILHCYQDLLSKYHFEEILVYIQAVGKHMELNDHEKILRQMNTFMQTIKSHKEQMRLLQAF